MPTDTAPQPAAVLFDAMWTEYRAHVLRYITAQVRNRHAAEDLTQETFIKAWRSIDVRRPDEGASLRPWLIKIARNTVIDHFRREGVRPVTLAGDGLVFAHRPSPAASPEETVISAEEWVADLASMQEQQRPVMRLRCELEFTEAEMATALRIPPGTVKSRLFYGRRTALARRAAP